MKAIRCRVRGGPEALVYEDAPVPRLIGGDVLASVHGVGITPTELTWNSTWTASDGKDRRPIVPGFEFSGVVDTLGDGVSGVKQGENVYGLLNFWRDGAAAEYVAVRAADLAPKPRSLDHLQAAAVPLSGLTAWQALFDHSKLSATNRVLIHGAAGGVGTWAVQLAHWRGAYTIGTASQTKHSFLRELGADEVFDYTSGRFDQKFRNIDLVLDTVGGETLERSWEVVRKGGVLVTIVGDAPAEKAAKYGIRCVSMLVQPSRDQLTQIGKLIDTGTIRPIIQEVFPLTRAPEAYSRGLLGHNRGKIVLDVSK
jgi:NADPH:quinone reductase-like Zn-dependent oxidoreductase